jgi:hypothetical protein
MLPLIERKFDEMERKPEGITKMIALIVFSLRVKTWL